MIGKKHGNIYLFLDMLDFTDAMYEECVSVLPPQRRERAERYHFMKDKKMCLIAYLLLVRGIEDTFALNMRGRDFSLHPYGKPYFESDPDVCFSLSHCVDGCVCAVVDGQVGVDIQDIAENRLRPGDRSTLYTRVLSEKEQQCLHTSSLAPEEAFTRFWALKESYVKCTGEGFQTDFQSLDFSEVPDVNGEFRGMYVSVRQERGSFVAVCCMRRLEWKIHYVTLAQLHTGL
ncbi:MAG: 4'-phosphopantetheinyl transferase superfamily protein [Peptococcaceae bacterium]|nr:4'-phosphopantetheinyl transferase superfamily protein [Peptococcaceae bacterium]